MKNKQRSLMAMIGTAAVLVVIALGATLWLLRADDTTASAMPAARILPNPASSDASAPLPVLFDAPSFSLTDQNGKSFGSDQLHGKVWVADFVFTECQGLCPMMTQHLAEFQKLTPNSPVQMVSFSVDPEHDTPAVLKGYATDAKADQTRWHFLTGTQTQTWEISKAMKLAVGPDKGNQVIHSSHFLLVDGKGQVRGVYDTEGPGFDLNKLAADANTLAHQK
jgi:protein SCO1/2